MNDDIRARHRKTIAVSTLLSTAVSAVTLAGVIGAPVWTMWLRPALAQSVAAEIADTIDAKVDSTVRERLAPVNSGLKAIILGNITRLEQEISDLEYVRDFQPAQWTEDNQRDLLRKQMSLRTQREAIAAILSAESR